MSPSSHRSQGMRPLLDWKVASVTATCCTHEHVLRACNTLHLKAAVVATYLKAVDGSSPRAAFVAFTAFVQQRPLGVGSGGLPARSTHAASQQIPPGTGLGGFPVLRKHGQYSPHMSVKHVAQRMCCQQVQSRAADICRSIHNSGQNS
eukprot:1137646-Pelagomonas_calceolata.AAC.6